MAQPDRPVEGASRADAAARPVRVPFNGTHRVLQASRQIPGYHLRVVNDVEDRIERFKAAGYEPVEAHEANLADPSCAEPSRMGSAVSKSVRGGVKGVLMKQKLEFYQEDQKAKQVSLDAVEATMQSDAEGKGLTTKLSDRQSLDGIKITRN